MDYFYQPDIEKEGPKLTPEESKHCLRVLRHKPGDLISVLDGKGSLLVCEIMNTDHKGTSLKIKEKITREPPPYSIHIGIAPTKSMDRMEWFVEKTVEIGISEITPVACDHSERKVIKTSRLIKKAISALKQSGNVFLPTINEMIKFGDFAQWHGIDQEKFLCHAEKSGDIHLQHVAGKNDAYLCLIGPEGDFSPQELEIARKQGFKLVSLGTNRLRTETAGIVACTLLNSINS